MTHRTCRVVLLAAFATSVWLTPAVIDAQIGTPNVWNTTALPAGPHSLTDVEVDPLFPDTVYASTIPGTIFRSFDQTATWTQVGAAIADDVLSMTLDPTNTAIIYAGTLGNGVYKSTNRAATWAATTLAGMPIVSMDIDPLTPATVYAASPDSLMQSNDSGGAWARVGPDSLIITTVLVSRVRPDTLFIGSDGDGVYRSTDGGTTFIRTNSGLTNLRVSSLAIHPTRTDTLYASTRGGGIFRTYDRGGTWTAVNQGITQTDMSAIAIARSNPAVLYAGSQNGRLFKSADNGTTWFDITLALADGTTVGEIAVQRDSANVVYAGLLNVHRLRQTGLDSVSFLPTGAQPTALASADLDGNGELDLVVANRGGNTVSIYLTDVALSSLARTDLLTGSGPSDAAIGDLDGDGDLDLAVGNQVKKTVSLSLNNGSGGFGTPTDLFIGDAVTFVALGDFDTDNDLDVAAVDEANGLVRLFLNDGLGSFGAPQSVPTSSDLEGFISGDFTGDGLLDFMVLSRTAAAFVLHANSGSAAFPTAISTAVGATPIRFAAADLDIDGNLDVVVATTDDRLLLFSNTGDGTFDTPVAIALSDTVTGLVAADIDQDGYADLVTPEPGGALTARINDGEGGFFVTPTAMGTVSGPGIALVGDYSGDGAPDVVVTRPNASGSVLRLSPVAQNIKDPAPPRDLAANDTQGDLGDNITLTWRRPRVDETTGRISLYRIFRADDEAGPYTQAALLDTSAASTKDSVFVNRSFIDPNATLGEDFFYYIITENAAGTQSARSDTVAAASDAQAFFDFQFDGSSPFHVRDTIDVTVRLNPADQDIQSFSLFLDYDRRALTPLDTDPTESGIQAFEVDPVLATLSQILENAHDTTTSTGLIDFGLGFLPDLNGEPTAIGKIQFVSLRDTTTRLRVVNDVAANRQTATTSRDDGSIVLPFVPPPTTLVLRNHRVWGSVSFQGDTEGLDHDARFDLTQSGPAGTPLPDSIAYAPPNDLDLNASGVQLKLAEDGSFVLQQVPTGSYGLFVKAFHFLRGRVSTDTLVVNDTLGVAANINFEWISPDSSIITTSLRAGDANNDNRVNLTDFGVLSAYFGTSGFAFGSAAWGADFNDDGVVNLSDFALLQSNFGEVGFGSALPAKPGLSSVRLALLPDPANESASVLVATDAENVVGFAADLVLSDGVALDREHLAPADWLRTGGDPLLLLRSIETAESRRTRVALAFRGASEGVSGSGSVLRILANPETITIENAQVLYGDGSLAPAMGLQHIPPDIRELFPAYPQLLQNHPNPFNPETVIPFDVSVTSPVRLRVYSPLGQEIRTLVDKAMPTGRHLVRWDGRDNAGREVASGVYLYQISIGSFVDVRKALLLR